jgi:hypothetical protein
MASPDNPIIARSSREKNAAKPGMFIDTIQFRIDSGRA